MLLVSLGHTFALVPLLSSLAGIYFCFSIPASSYCVSPPFSSSKAYSIHCKKLT